MKIKAWAVMENSKKIIWGVSEYGNYEIYKTKKEAREQIKDIGTPIQIIPVEINF